MKHTLAVVLAVLAASTIPSFAGPSMLEKLRGVHPRVFFSEADIQEYSRTYHADPTAYARYLPGPRDAVMKKTPAPFDYESWDGRQGSLADWAWMEGSALTSLSSAYRITGDPVYLEKFKEWVAVAPSAIPIAVTSVAAGNRDLSAGMSLLSLAFSYDLMKGYVDKETETLLRDATVAQAAQVYKDFQALKRPPYEQNHFSIPIHALLIASCALYDEVPEAPEWAAWAESVSDKCLAALPPDGWFHEGIGYAEFTYNFLVAAATAEKRVLDLNRFGKPPYKDLDAYYAHMYMPNPDFVFDFADWGPRVEMGGKAAQSGYDKPWHTLTSPCGLAIPFLIWKEQRGALLQNFLATVGQKGHASLGFALPVALQIPKTKLPASELPPPWHYFSNMEVVHWRTAWNDPDATAIAFKSGPPAGHHFVNFLAEHPNAGNSLGHSHPDAGSFILYAKGAFLANDTGYAIKETAYHNSILVDGIGQHKGGTPWSTFDSANGKSISEYDKIRMTDVWLAPGVMAATAVFDSAYASSFQLTKMNRSLLLIHGRFLVTLDDINSALPHEYQWLLHTDQKPESSGTDCFVMTNGSARLVVRNLAPVASSVVAPTVVETELYDYPKISRPQQRGFHLALVSPKETTGRFLTASCIQHSGEDPNSFQASVREGGRIVLTDGEAMCVVWPGPGDGLDGKFAYAWRENGESAWEIGLSGKSLRWGSISLSLRKAGQTVTTRNGKAGTP